MLIVNANKNIFSSFLHLLFRLQEQLSKKECALPHQAAHSSLHNFI
jgi:hypothetical protein